jgi:hypothetical protein
MEPGANSNLEDGLEGSVKEEEVEGDATKEDDYKQDIEEEDSLKEELEAKPPTLQNGDTTSLGDSSRSDPLPNNCLLNEMAQLPSTNHCCAHHIEHRDTWSYLRQLGSCLFRCRRLALREQP